MGRNYLRIRWAVASSTSVVSLSISMFDAQHIFTTRIFTTRLFTFMAPLERLQKLIKDIKERFRNVSRIMDCVSCEKCRLWGKLQVTGLGTALKILFSYGDK